MSHTAPFNRAEATARKSRVGRLFGGGTDGNEQLTATVGVILLILFAVLGVSIVRIGQLLWLHLFLGVILAGPVAIKIASTGYRFTRYYTGDPAYKRKGPPNPVMRALGPPLILTTLTVFVTGLLLLLDGPSASGTLRMLHKLSFFAWLAVVAFHVLGHLADLPSSLRAVSRSQSRTKDLPGSRGRATVIVGSIAAGLLLALLFGPQIHVWTSAGGLHGFHHFSPRKPFGG
jgi:hypothetical protein